MPIVKTRVEAAEILGVTEKTIGNWKLDDSFPKRDDDQYDTDEIAAWREVKNQQRTKTTTLTEQVSLKTKAVKLQILETKRQADELKLEKERGNLFERSLVLELLQIVMGRIKDVTANLQRTGNVAAAELVIEQMDLAKKLVNDRIDAAARDSAK